ncbi:hypothetical protein [Tenacibaculum maritimum]|uniref:hypothetical protein n=1 Tax=Tenacibaculum maritimum TaxID=107401 RepID=UPI0038769500
MKEFTVGEAGNTFNYALSVIVSKGYKIFLVPDKREDFFGDYWAINKTHRFVGSSPLVVLGLIGIWENYGDDWWNNQEKSPKDYLSLIENRALPNELADFENLTDIQFNRFVSEYRLLFRVLESWDVGQIKEGISRKELFDIINNYWKKE